MPPTFSLDAAIFSLAFLVMGLAIAWFAGRFIKPTEGAAILALLLLPFAAYLIFSGRMESFKGGGFEWKLQVAAAKPAGSATLKNTLSTDDLVSSAADSQNLDAFSAFGIPQEVILVKDSEWSKLNQSQRLQAAIKVGEVIYVSFLYGNFKSLIVVDDQNRPIALFTRKTFLDTLRIPFYLYSVDAQDSAYAATGGDVRAMIQQTELWTILRNPAVRASNSGESALFSENTSRIDALRDMISNNWDAAAVVDVRGVYKGLLWRPTLVETVLLAGFSDGSDE